MQPLPVSVYIRDFLHLFLPNSCLICRYPVQKDQAICSLCHAELPFTNFWERATNPLLEQLQARTPCAYASACFYFIKKSPIQQILHEIKYRTDKDLAYIMGRTFAEKLLPEGLKHKFDALTPVPLSAQKLKKRGFNQSVEIANGLSSVLDIPVETHLLDRIKDGKSQTSKSRSDRYYQLNGAFVVDEKNVRSRSLLVVDDVSTTGATAEICMSELLNAGANSCGLLCLAYRADF
ncbi:MAG: ComF family protein [Flavobacteriales bacterium]|nr:ComF family protein [Flavobacteriales bacterium]